MKIISACNDKYRPLLELTLPRLRTYCEKHGYDYQIYEVPPHFERPAAWYKIRLLLSEQTNRVLWIDADAAILNDNFSLHNILIPNKHIYLSKDANGINTGVMLWEKNTLTSRILQEIWDRQEYINNVWWEQAALMAIIEENFLNIQNHIEYIPQDIFNSYDYSLYSSNYKDGQVNKDSFIIKEGGILRDP